MSIYSKVDTGTTAFRSRFHKSISYSKRYDCKYGDAVPVLAKFCLPGDVWKIGGEVLVRMQPMLTPSLTPASLKVRYFFVPLRLIEPDTEKIITGSADGHLISTTLPKFKNFVADADKNVFQDAYKVLKHSFWDYMGVQTGDYEPIKNDTCLPAEYWNKAYVRIDWDYYLDENLSYPHSNFTDFESYYNSIKKLGASHDLFHVDLKKDYFTSSLPWQLKSPNGIAPAIDVVGTASFTPNFDFGTVADLDSTHSGNDLIYSDTSSYISQNNLGGNYDSTSPSEAPLRGVYDTNKATTVSRLQKFSDRFEAALNQNQTGLTITGLGFTTDDMRTNTALTRIYERAARCGSRYIEYMRSNFGISPADGTLQRSQYLGGWTLPIVTTEVLQTAEDGTTPVGTMRGHGITRGGNKIQTFMALEYGLLFGIAHIIPQTEYTTGIPKELTYKERFDFFNPSFQHLSEQEVKNGELYVSFTDGKNDDTFGFQAYANELRTSINQTVGDLRGTLNYWTQSLEFNSRPNLNSAFLSSNSHQGSYNKPFAYLGANARPCIVDFYNDLDVYRPLVRYSTPGLVDHL